MMGQLEQKHRTSKEVDYKNQRVMVSGRKEVTSQCCAEVKQAEVTGLVHRVPLMPAGRVVSLVRCGRMSTYCGLIMLRIGDNSVWGLSYSSQIWLPLRIIPGNLFKNPILKGLVVRLKTYSSLSQVLPFLSLPLGISLTGLAGI